MKKKKSIFVAAALLPLVFAVEKAGAAAPVAVVSSPIMETQFLQTLIFYGKETANTIESAINTAKQVEAAIRDEQRVLENLKGITQVSSFDDFMGWYNRQLSLERAAENRIKNMKLKVGNTSYGLKDIQDIPDAFDKLGAEAEEAFKNGLPPEKRRQVFINMGLSPANYAYLEAWNAKEKAIADVLLTSADTINDENVAAGEKNQAIAEKVLNDKVGEKGVLQGIFEVLMDTNVAIRAAHYDDAKEREWEAAKAALAKKPANPTTLSEDYWRKDPSGFGTTSLATTPSEEIDLGYGD